MRFKAHGRLEHAWLPASSYMQPPVLQPALQAPSTCIAPCLGRDEVDSAVPHPVLAWHVA